MDRYQHRNGQQSRSGGSRKSRQCEYYYITVFVIRPEFIVLNIKYRRVDVVKFQGQLSMSNLMIKCQCQI